MIESKLQAALDVIIKATIEGRIAWKTSSDYLPSTIAAALANTRDANAFEGQFAGLKLKLFDKTAKTFDISRFGRGILDKYPLEEVNLEIYEQGYNNPWRIPYGPRLDELMQAVRSYCDRLPPDSVIDKILNEGKSYER
jgi:hypothetical protein